MAHISIRGLRARWVVAIAIILAAGVSQGATPVFWRVSTQDDFLRGEVDNLTIDDAGRLQLGPASEVIYDTVTPFLWAASRAHDTLWVGSGNDGRVFAVSPDGVGTQVLDVDELDIHAVTAVSDERAYVGSSPHGKVYDVSISGPEARVFFDPDEQYIWALAQAPNGDLFVATGEPGRVYRVSPDGSSILFYDTNTTHVLSLAVEPDGSLLAGTASPGRVFRISENGRGFVLLDTAFGEIRSLRLDADGQIYAVGVNESPGSAQTRTGAAAPTATPAASPSTSTSTTVTAVVTVSTATATNGTSASAPASSGAASGAVFRIAPDGIWDTVWGSSTDTPYDAIPSRVDGETSLLIATGRQGKIFRVATDPPRETLLSRVPAAQVTQFIGAADGSIDYITANPGKVYRLSASRATGGSYLSEVRDATTISTWGTVRWRATTPSGSSVSVQTRSGNTREPSATWSPWSEPYEDADGSPITSPKARYLQWKAELRGRTASPSLLAVTTAYLPRNARPEITSLTVHEPGVAFQQPFPGTDPPIAGLSTLAEARSAGTNQTAADASQSTLGRRVYRKGLQTFVWTAQDDNADELEFDVLYRSETESAWLPLTTSSRSSVFAWDTSTTPDGTYLVRIVASDQASNAPGAALTGYKDTAPFDVDNTAPRIIVSPSRVDGATTVVPFVVDDAFSPVERVEFSLDTERWQIVYPVDGIPDSRVERFEVSIATQMLDRLVIRAADSMGNVATAAGR